jgi:hypothetical protein
MRHNVWDVDPEGGTMKVTAILQVVVILACATAASAWQNTNQSGKVTSTDAAFEQFKSLAGDWTGKELGKDGHDLHVNYKVTAGGSAVVETIFPGSEHEMVTVIHRDGDGLLLTHYCMLGNQPQMKSSGPSDGKKIEFKFVRATGLKSDKDMHMHDATYTFVDSDTLRTEWTHYNDGKAAGQVVFDLKRKK